MNILKNPSAYGYNPIRAAVPVTAQPRRLRTVDSHGPPTQSSRKRHSAAWTGNRAQAVGRARSIQCSATSFDRARPAARDPAGRDRVRLHHAHARSRRRRFPSSSPATTSWAAPRPAPARPPASACRSCTSSRRTRTPSPSPARHPVRALILAPTRELAIQVEEQIKEYGKYTDLRSTVRLRRRGHQASSCRSCAPASRSSSPRRAACSTTSSRRASTSARSRSSCSTKPTGCSTWASSPTSSGSWRCCRREAAEPAVLGDVLQRDQEARRRAAERAAADRSRAAQYRGRNGRAERVPGAAGREARRCSCTS